jgi:hypothetical protein
MPSAYGQKLDLLRFSLQLSVAVMAVSGHDPNRERDRGPTLQT